MMGSSDIKDVSEGQPEKTERAIIKKFRTAVADILTPERDNDKFLLKWLIARNFNIEKAEQMLRKHVRFTKVNNLDQITPDFVPVEATKYFYTTMLGFDNEGSVVRYVNIGGSDIKGLSVSISKREVLQYCTHMLGSDSYLQKLEKSDTACDKRVFINDLKGMTWRSAVNRAVAERAFLILKFYEANHPENLKIVYILNAPTFFSFIYSWLKTVLPETIVSKIRVVSPEECPEVLSKTMDLSIVPASIGGLRTDPDGDPNCPNLFRAPLGLPVPESLMPKNQLEVLLNDPEAKRAKVERRSCFILENVVTVPESMLQWDIQTLQVDIRLGLNFKKDQNSERETIIPIHRVESHMYPESGSFLCQNLGIYEIVLDNTYSWLTKKELIYKVNVVLPNNSEEN